MKRALLVLLVLSLSMLFLMCGKKKQETVLTETTFQVEEMQPFTYCAMEKTGSFEQQTEAWKIFLEELTKQNIPNGETVGVYFNDPKVVPVDSLSWDCGMIIPDSVVVTDPLKKKTWSFTSVVTKEYEGPLMSMDLAYEEINKSITDNGYKICGPSLEKFLTEPALDSTGQMAAKVKIIFPVEKIQVDSAAAVDTTAKPVQ